MDTSFSGQQFCLGNGFLARQDLLLKLIRALSLEQGSMLAIIWLCGLSKCKIWHM